MWKKTVELERNEECGDAPKTASVVGYNGQIRRKVAVD